MHKNNKNNKKPFNLHILSAAKTAAYIYIHTFISK